MNTQIAIETKPTMLNGLNIDAEMAKIQSIADSAPFRHKNDLLRWQEGLRKGGVPYGISSRSSEFEDLVEKSDKGYTVKGVRTIKLDEAIKLHAQGTLFIDNRSRAGRMIPGTVWLDYKTKMTPENLAKHAKKDTQIVFYCDGFFCHKAAYSCAKAATWGYTNILYFAGGFPAWDKAGLETIKR
jgi:adenylate cyclase